MDCDNRNPCHEFPSELSRHRASWRRNSDTAGHYDVQLFFPDFGETLAVGDITFGPPTAALTAGLAVKPIYAAFEALAEGIASLIPGQNK